MDNDIEKYAIEKEIYVEEELDEIPDFEIISVEGCASSTDING